MDRRQFLALGIAGAAGLAFASPAMASTWVYLGRRKVHGLMDRNRVLVSADAGNFSALRLHTTGNDLALNDVSVRYGNGDNEDLPLRLLADEGSCSHVVDLGLGDRRVRRVAFTYEPFDNDRPGPTWVELYGLR
jgi:hypothetical protein